ncbi:MAG: IS21 family transposase, partial [Acidobacteria bacterium]
RRIEQATGVRRETAGAYLKAAGIAVRPPCGWGRRAPAKPANEVITDSESKPANEVITDFIRQISEKQPIQLPPPNPSASACEPFRDTIELGLSRGRNAMAIWQDIVTDYGFSGGYQTVQRFVRKLRGSPGPEPVGIIVTAPGEECQVDYGTGPMVRDPQSGKYRRTRLFVMTLGYSRKAVRLLVFRSSSRTWAELHETAFRRLGGSCRVLILDNLKEGVLEPDIYDPTLNPLFKDVLAHYGVVAMPCRVQDPDRKGKVESGVGHAQKTPLKGLRFESLDEAQVYLDHWELRWADTRIHGRTKRQVAAMFAEEKPFLLPLPLEPFRYYQYGERVVHLDGCIEVEAAYYGLPPGWIGKLVKVQWDSLHVRILDPRTHQLLREHVRQQRGRYRIKPEDNPEKTPFTTVQLLTRAARAGSHIGALCEAIHRHQGEAGIRRILGVLSLAKKFGVNAVEDACAAALELGVYEYRFIRRFLERRPQLTLRQVDPLIRELVQYRDLINMKIQEQDHESD